MKKIIIGGSLLLLLVVGGLMAWRGHASNSQIAKTQKSTVESTSTSKSSTTKETERTPEKKEAVVLPEATNQKLNQLLFDQRFSGTALVVRKGQVVLNHSYGMADQEKQRKNTPTTRYYIGSAQKAIIAT